MSWLAPFFHFNKGLKQLPVGWQAFVALQSLVNVIAPIMFRDTLQAQVTLVVFGLNTIVLYLICAKTGFSRLLGLGHIFWIPLVIWFMFHLPSLNTSSALGLWMIVLLTINGFSLIVDTIDVVRFIAGDRADRVVSSSKNAA